MTAPKSIARLVEHFLDDYDDLHSPHHNEASVRGTFIEPLFEELGWDVNNTKERVAEPYKDVVIENRARECSGIPDYTFRVGSRKRFYVEAKKPSVNLKEAPEPASQLRRYAWSAKLPLSILTNFEELCVYEGATRPHKADLAHVARLKYIRFTDYGEQWDWIADRFSKESVLKGRFDRFAESETEKKGTLAVDDSFLKQIQDWRSCLARNIALRNHVSDRQLNFAVQATIDRIVFLRICEDRGIEPPEHLRALLEGSELYGRLGEAFLQADKRYNSGLFHFREERGRATTHDSLTLDLTIDDKILKEVINSLYYPESPYQFSVIPTEILGQVYERFLGHVIRLDSAGQAEVKEKPEVRKAGGVYYTPTYIADYIVQSTVARLLEGKEPKDVARFRVLDPACGSGSFLLGAYQQLLDWHQTWYAANEPARWSRGRSPRIYRSPEGDWRLRTAERKRILLDHIYGVDIDLQAVEVTKLSLLLKVIEAEQLGLFREHERVLPDLGTNIQCGNSLIGEDFSDDHPLASLSDEERYRINPFDWKAAFPDAMKDGGFDAIIGNPPYSNYSARDSMRAFYERAGMADELEALSDSIRYCSARYARASVGCKDAFKWFLYKGQSLLSKHGLMGMIVPNTWFTHIKYRDIRECLFDGDSEVTMIDLGFGVFPATVPTSIVIYGRGERQGRRYCDLRRSTDKAVALAESMRFQDLEPDGSAPEPELVEKYLRKWPREWRLGTQVTLREGQHIPRSGLVLGRVPRCIPVTDSKNMSRYSFVWEPRYCFDPKSVGGMRFRATSGPRLLIRKTGDSIVASVTPPDRSYVLQSLYQSVAISADVETYYLLGLLNSRFLTVIYQGAAFGQKGRTMAQFRKAYLDVLPVPVVGGSTPQGRKQRDRLTALVQSMLELHGALLSAGTDHEATLVQRQIDATDRKIDQLVYELYGLTDDEIRIVEEGTLPIPPAALTG